MENLIKNEGTNCQSMTIDALCVKQGIEYNFSNIRVVGVFNNDVENRIYDAEIIKNGEKIRISNIEVDNRCVGFDDETIETLEG